jgi:hypothetical protein
LTARAVCIPSTRALFAGRQLLKWIDYGYGHWREMALIARENRQVMATGRCSNRDICKARQMTAAAVQIRQCAGNLRRRGIEWQYAIRERCSTVRSQADKSAAFRLAPVRLAFAMPSAISATVTADRKRWSECASIHSMILGRITAVVGA